MKDLVCTACETARTSTDLVWRCTCGGPLDLRLESAIDLDAARTRPATMWRYREALPIADDHVVSFDEGFTPLTQIRIDGHSVWIKQENLFPTGSFKDRGASVLISKARELGVRRVVEDSSGNAGAAVAAYAARAGMACDIYVPEATSPAKLTQIRMYGATLHRVPGSREDTARAAMEAAEECFYASHVWNPYFFQGTRTFVFEICEQLGCRAPDVLVIPTGHGTLLIGAYLGFIDLLRCGHISSLPRLVAVQSSSCAPLYRAWRGDLESPTASACGVTIAEGIAIAEPTRASQVIDAVRHTGGQVVTVTDDEVRKALTRFCLQGWYIEPTSATALAGLSKAGVSDGETVVVPLTGHGLKSTEKLIKLTPG